MTGPRFSRTCRTIANIVASAGVSPQVIMIRGAAICALVEALEMSGRRAEVIMACGVRNGANTYSITVPVKEPDQPLDMDRLAFMLCHPAVLRRFVFSLMETESATVRRELSVPGCYGHAADTDTEGDVVVGRADWSNPAWRSVEGAREWVLNALREQGVMLVAA
jgi:hypothetical protein